jgi:signal transduction histidine kinase
LELGPNVSWTVLFPNGVSRKKVLEGGLVDVSIYPGDEETVFEVKDSGRTIADHDLDYILDQFLLTRALGWRMGWAIVERIVCEHIGKIEMGSKVGAGTTLRLVLLNRSE